MTLPWTFRYFKERWQKLSHPWDHRLVEQIYGYNGEARKLFTDATGITFLDEGTHFFRLQNGASLSVYASPYTPSLGDWGFQYHPDQGHSFSIHNIDVAITHGPPKGIMDLTHLGERAGCPYVFEAIARARPRMHCFGHIHEAWGAKLVTWRHKISQNPSHLSDIDNGKSVIIGRLSNVRNYVEFATTSHCPGDPSMLEWCSQTLFVNASIDGTQMLPIQPPWFVDLELSPASRLSSEASSSSTTS